MIEWVDKYIGIPYKKFGKDRKGADCYGLISCILEKEFGKILPDLNSDYEDKHAIQKIFEANAPVIAGEPVSEPVPGDIAVFKFYNMPIHMAYYLGDNKVLHTLLKSDSCIERMDSARLKGRFHGFYRIR